MIRSGFFFTLTVVLGISASAEALTATQRKAAAEHLKVLQALGVDPAIVAEVKAYNAAAPAESKDMTNEKWKQLTVLDPFVRSFTKNSLAQHLKSKKDDSVTEMFVSGADGGKVAFLAKTTSWNHKGREKHDTPMKGTVWFGEVELDQSSGQRQVQVAFPVLDGSKPIGSVVVGISIGKLN